MDEAVQILEDKACWKSLSASIVELDDINPSTSYDYEIRRCHSLHARDIATAIYRARTYNCEKKHLCCRSKQSTTSVSWKLWYRRENGDLTGATTGSFNFWFGDKNRQKIVNKGNIILLEPTLQSHLSLPKRESKKNPELENKGRSGTCSRCWWLNSTAWRQTAAMGMTSTSREKKL